MPNKSVGIRRHLIRRHLVIGVDDFLFLVAVATIHAVQACEFPSLIQPHPRVTLGALYKRGQLLGVQARINVLVVRLATNPLVARVTLSAELRATLRARMDVLGVDAGRAPTCVTVNVFAALGAMWGVS